jgi:hypothetical protein
MEGSNMAEKDEVGRMKDKKGGTESFRDQRSEIRGRRAAF